MSKVVLQKGLHYFWVSAFLRVQLLPAVQLTAGESCTVLILARSLGTLTGSRTAVAAGRIPVESTACKLASTWEPHAVTTDMGHVICGTWVDNYYAFGRCLHSAVYIAESFEAALLRDWGLCIKASSRSVLSPEEPQDPWDRHKWPLLSQADILGHLVSGDCSPWPCWRRTLRSMWAAYWRNCVGPVTSALSLSARCKLLNRCVRPILHFRNTRWPYTHALAEEQDRVQRQMLLHFLRLERLPTDDDNAYFRRRMRAVASVARVQGSWGLDHARRVVAW